MPRDDPPEAGMWESSPNGLPDPNFAIFGYMMTLRACLQHSAQSMKAVIDNQLPENNYDYLVDAYENATFGLEMIEDFDLLWQHPSFRRDR